MKLAVRATGIAKDHAGEKALKGISFRVPMGSLFGIIGADGAGKSTLMEILTTLKDPDSGKAEVLGMDLASGMASIRRDIGYMPQRFSLYQDLSVEENLDFFADVFGLTGAEKKERMLSLLAFAALGDFKSRRAGNLSGGMKQKLALACTLIHKPRLLFLDEPTVGVDPVARRDFWILLKSLRAEGIALVVSTPYMDEAALCDHLVLLHSGSILAEGSPAQLLSAYPYRLYKVEGEGTLHYPADKPPPEGFLLLYPAAGNLHAVEARPLTDPSHPAPNAAQDNRMAALNRIKAVVPGAMTLSEASPTVEDFFFAQLSLPKKLALGPKEVSHPLPENGSEP